MAMVRINFSIQPEVLAELDRIASDMNLTRSALIALMVRIINAFESNESLVSVLSSFIKEVMGSKKVGVGLSKEKALSSNLRASKPVMPLPKTLTKART
jgi:metal-responsive CopG/Arc/MetJ family transcriptional regulator